MNIVDLVCNILKYAFVVLTFYKWVYIVIGFFARKTTFKDTEKLHRYGIVICARNEEKVLPKLLESIALQNYPKELLTTYVVCDNCNDNTEKIAREMGAVAIVRNEPEKQRKGYALEYAFDRIDIDSHEGFFIIDSDNLLSENFVREMNKAFDEGYKVVTGYRNIKNFDTNVISSGYGFHFYANNIAYHRPRQSMKLGTHLTGTGYLFDAGLIKESGWHFTNMTEDDEFTINVNSKNIRIAFCEDAEFFDEQPVDVGTAFRQRVRWARGRLVAFLKNAGKLFKAIFTQKNFTGYDLFWHYFPTGMCTWILGIIYPITSIVSQLVTTGRIDISVILTTIGGALLLTALYGLLTSILVVIKERKRIHCKKGLLILYLICSPWFLLVDTFNNLVALFWDIKWTRIRHDDDRGIENVY